MTTDETPNRHMRRESTFVEIHLHTQIKGVIAEVSMKLQLHHFLHIFDFLFERMTLRAASRRWGKKGFSLNVYKIH